MINNIVVVLRDGGLYTITKEQISMWTYIFPEVNVYEEVLKMQKAWENGTLARRTAKNINKFVARHLEYKAKENAS